MGIQRREATTWGRLAARVLAVLLSVQGANAGAVKIEGRVVDAHGCPMAGVRVAPGWNVDAKTGEYRSPQSAATDAEGRFSLMLEASGRDVIMAVYDAGRENAGLVVVPEGSVGKSVEIRLSPAVRIHGRFDSKELGRAPEWLNLQIFTTVERSWVVQRISTGPDFSLSLPAGDYRMTVYGVDFLRITKPLTLGPSGLDVDLGTIDLPAQPVALLEGKPMPPWKIVDARGAKKDVTIADYHGKWVLVDIWGFWCAPCVQHLSELIDFHEVHEADRDRFEIIALHDGTVKDLAELDARTAGTRKNVWRGRNLPFPVLIDAQEGEHGATVKALGIDLFPTILLIDPRGIVVGRGRAAVKELEAALLKKK